MSAAQHVCACRRHGGGARAAAGEPKASCHTVTDTEDVHVAYTTGHGEGQGALDQRDHTSDQCSSRICSRSRIPISSGHCSRPCRRRRYRQRSQTRHRRRKRRRAAKKPCAARPVAPAKMNPPEAFGVLFGGKPKPRENSVRLCRQRSLIFFDEVCPEYRLDNVKVNLLGKIKLS